MHKFYISTSKSVLKRFVADYLWKYNKKSIYIALLCMIISAISTNAIIRCSGFIIDEIIINKNYNLLIFSSTLLLLIFVTKGIAEYCQYYTVRSMGQGTLNDLQLSLYAHLLNDDVEFIQSTSSSQIVSRFTNDISTIKSVISYFATGVLKHIFVVIFAVISMFYLDFYVGCIIVLYLLTYIIAMRFMGSKIQNLVYNTQTLIGDYSKILGDIFASIKVVKSLQIENVEYEKAKIKSVKILELSNQTAKQVAFINLIVEIINGITLSLILLYHGALMDITTITPGTIINFIGAFRTVVGPFKYILTSGATLNEGIGALKRIFELLDHNPTVLNTTQVTNPSLNDINIEFLNVAIGDFNNSTILQNINFAITPQQHITGIIGKSGSGKTSLVQSLMRFSNIKHGDIRINGVNLLDIDLEYLRSNITLIPQTTIIFDGTIADNIKCGNPQISIDDIVFAARMADADEFIMNTPNQYETLLGPSDLTLSDGQKQRIAIARGIARKGAILILDEATNALDYKSEVKIFNNIKQLQKNKCAIFITHRINNIRDADMIIVLDDCAICGIGTDEELRKNNLYYQHLIGQ